MRDALLDTLDQLIGRLSTMSRLTDQLLLQADITRDLRDRVVFADLASADGAVLMSEINRHMAEIMANLVELSRQMASAYSANNSPLVRTRAATDNL